MITFKHVLTAVSVATLLLSSVDCDSGSPSRTPDEIAADSALASDLALANRDTLVVDSIGAYRAPDAAEREIAIDSTVSSGSSSYNLPVKPAPVPASPAQPTVVATAPPAAAPVAPPVTAPATAPAAAPAKPAARLTGTRACSSPLPENQSECVRVTLAATDMRLNRIYRALITEIRRQEKVAPGAKDPPSVARLRVSQRSWMVYRDAECRKRGRRREGALWARPRVKCLGEFSVRRANELADNFSRLTAH